MGRQLIALVLVAMIALAHPALVIAQGACSVGPTWLTGDSFTASAVNSLQTRLGSTNMISSCIDGQGDTNAMFDDTLAPTTSAGARVLSTQLYHDVAQLRYVALHVFGATNWWSVPYENVNFRHRMVRQHFGTLFHAQQAFRAEAHLSSASTRFHFVAIGTDREMAAGSAHPESAWFLIHVNASVRFMVGLGGDVHVGNTLAVHAAGTVTHAAIFRPPSTGTGVYWPATTSIGLSVGGVDGIVIHAAASTRGLWTGAANAYDLGSPAGGGFRNAHLTGTLHAAGLVVGQGVSATPGIRGTAANSASDTGIMIGDTFITFVIDGTDALSLDTTGSDGLRLRGDAQYRWTSAGLDTGTNAGLSRCANLTVCVTDGSTGNGAFQIGGATALTLSAGALGFARMTASLLAPGATGLKLEVVCGTNAGTAKIQAYAGTSATPVTLTDNIGSGVTGC